MGGRRRCMATGQPVKPCAKTPTAKLAGEGELALLWPFLLLFEMVYIDSREYVTDALQATKTASLSRLHLPNVQTLCLISAVAPEHTHMRNGRHSVVDSNGCLSLSHSFISSLVRVDAAHMVPMVYTRSGDSDSTPGLEHSKLAGCSRQTLSQIPTAVRRAELAVICCL